MTSYRGGLKHGQDGRLPALGARAVRLPSAGEELPRDAPRGPDQVPGGGDRRLAQIFIFVGFLEFLGLKIKEKLTYKAGDLLGASELVDDTDAGWVDYQLKELNNGRLAMFAIMGFWIQDLLFGSAADMLFKPMVG